MPHAVCMRLLRVFNSVGTPRKNDTHAFTASPPHHSVCQIGNEIAAHSFLRHPRVPPLVDVYAQEAAGRVHLVFPYAGGRIFTYVRDTEAEGALSANLDLAGQVAKVRGAARCAAGSAQKGQRQ